jgi:hypothetical protein
MRARALVWVALLAAPALAADKLSPKVEARLKQETEKVREMAKDPAVVKAVEAQNARKMTAAQVNELDKQWMASDPKVAPLVKELTGNACATHLKAQMAKSPVMTEAIVMDQQGANVCITNRTSDYWQGDEDKWRKAYNNGKGGTDVGAPKYDESAKDRIIQVSVAVLDAKKKAIGALCVGLKVDAMEKGR